MAADPELVERLHALLADEPSLEPKPMFGGVGFMVEGSLAIAAMGGGGVARTRGSRGRAGPPRSGRRADGDAGSRHGGVVESAS